MQLLFDTGLTSEDYVSREGWRDARLERCPRHPGGGCDFRRHGTYLRKRPEGVRVPRWYCRSTPETFSLLPRFLAARLPGTLAEVEQVVTAVERAPSLQAAADHLRPAIELPGAMRWTRRRVRQVHGTLTALRGVMPERFATYAATITAFAQSLDIAPVLPALRTIAADYLAQLPPPLGFHHRVGHGGDVISAVQHTMGPDPPPGDG